MKNVDQLRHAIDRGKTASKVDAPDPAAAPLGTDEEAAGTPVGAREVQAAWEAERHTHEPTGTGSGSGMRHVSSNNARSGIVLVVAFLAAIALALSILLAA